MAKLLLAPLLPLLLTPSPVHAMTLVEMSEPATMSRPGDPVIRLQGRGSIKTVELRPHSKGGGYIGDVRIQKAGAPMSGNLATYRFGRGWQSSIRENKGGWNPTQGGFRETVGVATKLIRTTTGVAISPFQVPLFQNKEFDFTEQENLARDDFPQDGGTDDDRLAENGSQADEVWSEVEYFGQYNVLNLGIPAFRHRFSYTLNKPPGAIRQWRTNAVDASGNTVYNPALVRQGFDELEPSNITLSYGVRMQDINGWTSTHGNVGLGVLRGIPKSPDGNDNRERLEIDVGFTPRRPLGMMATNKAGSLAIGIYVLGGNAGPVNGDESRLLNSRFVFVRDSGGANLIYRALIDGLHLGERIETDLIILFGSRAEILRAVQDLESRGM